MFSLKNQKQFRLQRFVYTRHILQALVDFHESGKLHLALTPAHILIDGDSVQIIAALDSEKLLYDAQRYAAPELLVQVGMSEQTDLYALGRILFEAWSGVLPDEKENPLPSLTQFLPELPPGLDRFFQTLMAPQFHDRYSNAESALYAFQAFEAYFYPLERRSLFIGRKQELKQLNDWLDASNRGIYFIQGQPGVGKSALLQEVLSQRTYLSGKFQQAMKYTPSYAVFIESMQSFLRFLLSLSLSERLVWKEIFQIEMGLSAQVLFETLPELALILNETSQTQFSGNLILENPFNRAFAQLWQVVSSHQQLIVWLDDVQWADDSSLHFFRQLFPLNILWLISGREIQLFRQQSESSGDLNAELLVLSSFEPQSTHLYLQEALGASFSETESLLPVLQDLTQGNPLYLKVSLEDFKRRKLLTFQPELGVWSLNWSGERTQNSFSEQILQDMIGRQVAAFSELERALLGIAACLGARFAYLALKTCFLQIMTNSSVTDLKQALSTCVRAGFLHLDQPGFYRFAHDRLHEWIHLSFSAEESTQFRLKTGRVLLTLKGPHSLTGLAETLNPVYQSLDPEELTLLIDANLELSDQALKKGAQAEALAFLSAVQLMASEQPFSPEQEIKTLALMAFLDYLKADLSNSERKLKSLLNKFPDANLTDVYVLLVILYTQQNRYQEAVEFTVTILNQAGLEISQEPAQIEALFSGCIQTLSRSVPSDLLDLSLRPSSPAFADILRLFATSTAAFYNYQPELFGLYVLYFLDQILHHQGAPQSGIIYAASIILVMAQTDLVSVACLLADGGLLTAQSWGHLDELAVLHCVIGDFLAPWHQAYRQACSHFESSWRAGLQSGNLQFAGYSRVFKGANLFLSGVSLEDFQTKELPAMLAFNATIQNFSPLDGLTGYALLLHALRQEAECFDLPNQTEADYIALIRGRGSQADLSRYFSFKAFVLLLYGQIETAADNYRQADNLRYLQGSVVNVLHLFTGLILALRRGESLDTDAHAASLQKLNQLAERCPENFGPLMALVIAEDPAQANQPRIEAYERAVTLARQEKLNHIEAFALESESRFWQLQALPRLAERALFESALAYQSWGATEKVNQLLLQFPQRLKLQYEQHVQLPHADLDLDLLMQISALFAQTTKQEELLAAIMTILQTQTKAEKMALFIAPETATEVTEWTCLAHFDQGQLHLQERPLDAVWPLALIRYVVQTLRIVRLPRHLEELNQIPEARQLQGSHFFLPLILQNRLTGLIYLCSESNPEAFNLRSELLLKALAGHIASSLTNARMYHQLEATILERTQDLQKANHGLTLLLEERQHVIAMAAHDLKHPLGTLTLGVSLLEQMHEQLSPQDRQAAFLNLKKTLSDMNGNTERLLLAESLDFGGLEVHVQPISPKADILPWFSPYQFRAQEKQIEFQLFGFETPQCIYTDPILFRHIVENLCSNALNFSPFKRKVRLFFECSAETFAFAVEDQGPGIPVDEQPKLFQKFSRLTPRPTAGESSSGLGLFIVKQLVEIFQGKIVVDSEIGRGTRIQVQLPNAHKNLTI